MRCWHLLMQIISTLASANKLVALCSAQFDRSGRAKSESLSGLEEVLTCLQPTVFCDDQLSRYRGLCWSDFLQLLFKQTTDKATKVTLITGISQDRFLERSGLPSAGIRVPPSSRILTRQSTQQDYSSRLKVGDTHSSGGNSSI